MTSIGLLITAAGVGTRFSGTTNKLFAEIDGKPLIIRTLEKFESISDIAEAVITTHPDVMDQLRTILNASDIKHPYQIIEGGAHRQTSVKKGVMRLQQCQRVMIHDAARPNPSLDLITRLLAASLQSSAVIPGCRVTDTMKRIDTQGNVIETLDREALVRVQTPQVFQTDLLMRAYSETSTLAATDEAMLIEALGETVTVIDGDPNNIKVTFSSDLEAVKISG